MSRSLEARIAYLKMEEIVMERHVDHTKDSLKRFETVLQEYEDILENIRADIVNSQDLLDAKLGIS